MKIRPGGPGQIPSGPETPATEKPATQTTEGKVLQRSGWQDQQSLAEARIKAKTALDQQEQTINFRTSALPLQEPGAQVAWGDPHIRPMYGMSPQDAIADPVIRPMYGMAPEQPMLEAPLIRPMYGMSAADQMKEPELQPMYGMPSQNLQVETPSIHMMYGMSIATADVKTEESPEDLLPYHLRNRKPQE